MAARGENFDCEDVARLKGATSNSFDAGCLFETFVAWGQDLKAWHTLVV